MSDWKHKRIEDIAFFNPPCSLKIGNPAKKIPMSYLKEFQRKIIGYEISEYVSGPKFINGDTLVAKITPCLENGKTAFVDILEVGEIAFGSSEFIVLRAKEGNDKLFLYYLSISPTFREKAVSCMEGTSGRKRVNETSLKNQELPIPDFATQQRISSVLSSLDAKIELNNKINRELEAVAKTLYDYWFVQFNFPDKNGKPYKSSGGKMVWNEQLKREIPEGWEAGSLGIYCMSTGGFAFKSSSWSDEGISVVKIKDIQEDYTIDISNLSKADVTDINIDEKFKTKPGDILIAMTGATVGKYGIVPTTDYPLYVNQRVGFFNLGVEPTKKLPFLINSLNQPYFRNTVFSIASGAAQPNISNEQINDIPLLIPDKILMDNYNLKFSPYYKDILTNQKENQQLSSLRDWLLPMLMNGQVTVQEAEERISMVAEQEVGYGE